MTLSAAASTFSVINWSQTHGGVSGTTDVPNLNRDFYPFRCIVVLVDLFLLIGFVHSLIIIFTSILYFVGLVDRGLPVPDGQV